MSVASRAASSFLNLFRPRPLVIPPDLDKRPELDPGDYQARREMYPVYPLSGWSPQRIIQMLEAHDVGDFTASELFYHALRKEGLISAAMAMRKESALEFASTLQCPKEAPAEMHAFTECLARDWQAVIPDDVRGEIIERAYLFGFMVCRVQWTWNNGQKQMKLHPWTHSSLSVRTDLGSPDAPVYQGLSMDRGVELISSDGREWIVFTVGGTRPWLAGLIRCLAFVYFGIITGDDRWLNFNDKFAEPLRLQYTPRLTRETPEAQRLYDKVRHMRGGDLTILPREGKDTGYDFRYEQVDAQGYETLKDQLERFDTRAAIIILGHNLLQQVKGGSLAAMKEAKGLLRTKSVGDLRVVSTGCEPLSKVWARANFGQSPDDFAELGGKLPEQVSWSLVYDTTDPDIKELAAGRAQKFGDAFLKFITALVAASGIGKPAAPPPGLPPEDAELAAAELDADFAAVDLVVSVLSRIDFAKAAEQCGIPLLGGEESYHQDDAKEAELGASWRRPVRRLLGRRAVALLAATPAQPVLALLSGDSPDSAAGLIEGQQAVDDLADTEREAPGLAAALAALAAATDWADLRERLTGLVEGFDLRDHVSELEELAHQAEHIGAQSIDHDLPASARAEVDAAERARKPAQVAAELRAGQQRSSALAKAAGAYALYAVAHHLWQAAATAEAQGQPLDLHRQELAGSMSPWGPGGALWVTAAAEPLQHAFTHGRARRLQDAAVRAVAPYWRYDAVLDGRTTPLCRGLNGYTRPAGDPSMPIPPLHWRCRSTIRGVSRMEGEAAVSAPKGIEAEPGFGMDGYPRPVGGPDPLMVAYRAQMGS